MGVPPGYSYRLWSDRSSSQGRLESNQISVRICDQKLCDAGFVIAGSVPLGLWGMEERPAFVIQRIHQRLDRRN